MARIRSVHPDICTDETLVDVSASAERTFIRLWTHLDDAGRVKYHAKLLAASLYPLHDDMDAFAIEADVDELVAAGCLLRYEVEGKDILAAKAESWGRYQKPRHPRPSDLPGQPEPYGGTPTPDGGTSQGAVTAERRQAPAGGEGRGVEVGDGDIAAAVTPAATHAPEFSTALLEACGQDPAKATERERTKASMAANEIRAAGGVLDDLAPAVAKYRQEFSVPVSPMALASNWSRLVSAPASTTDPTVLAHGMGAARARQGIYQSEADARDEFESMYASQPELVEAALAGWRDVGAAVVAMEVPALSEPEQFGSSLSRSVADHLEAEDAVAGQFEDPGDRTTAMSAWDRARRQAVPA